MQVWLDNAVNVFDFLSLLLLLPELLLLEDDPLLDDEDEEEDPLTVTFFFDKVLLEDDVFAVFNNVVLDDLAAAFATVAFVGFISALVDRTYTATQYALLASIGTAGRTLFASSSGALVDWLNGDWGIFFIITALMVIPSLTCLYLIRKKLRLNE